MGWLVTKCVGGQTNFDNGFKRERTFLSIFFSHLVIDGWVGGDLVNWLVGSELITRL